MSSMARSSKLSQLQIRVSKEEKSAIHKAADSAGMDMSAYVLSRLLPARTREFQDAIAAVNGPAATAYALAELNALLSQLTGSELRGAVASAPETQLSPFLANYIAAMVETACA